MNETQKMSKEEFEKQVEELGKKIFSVCNLYHLPVVVSSLVALLVYIGKDNENYKQVVKECLDLMDRTTKE